MASPQTPYLSLDLDAFEANVETMLQHIVRDGGKAWRPHVKAIRSPELALRLVRAGAHGVTTSTVAAARLMVDAGIDDVLVATEVVGDANLAALAALNGRARVMCATDSAWHAATVSAAGARAGVRIPVLIEIDVGLKRAGTTPLDAPALAAAIDALPGVRLCGLMAWEGHATAIADRDDKARAVRAAIDVLLDAAARCRAAGHRIDIVSCGGTGTFEQASPIAGVTELEAGGGVFGDERYLREFGAPLRTALTLVTTVVSRPTARRIVCDAGWKATGVHPRPSAPLALQDVERVSWSAEHLTIVFGQDGVAPSPGERLSLAIGYADATVFLHRALYTTRDGRLEGSIPLPDGC